MTVDDTTLNNAGEVGRELADSLTEEIIGVIDGFPAVQRGDVSPQKQRGAMATMIANSLYNYAEETAP